MQNCAKLVEYNDVEILKFGCWWGNYFKFLKNHNFFQETVQNLKSSMQNCAKLIEYNDVEKNSLDVNEGKIWKC